MAIITETYSGVRIPVTTFTFDTDTLSITASCDIIGLAPDRGVSADESLDGILSLTPPTVITYDGEQAALDLLIRAVTSSAFATPDIDFDIPTYGNMVYAVTRGYREAYTRALSDFTNNELVNFGFVNLVLRDRS